MHRVKSSKIIGLLLLVIFLTGITPKKYFHDIIFDHTDELVNPERTEGAHFEIYHAFCGFINDVAPAPFLAHSFNVVPAAIEFVTVFNQTLRPPHLYTTLFSFCLRGPPVA